MDRDHVLALLLGHPMGSPERLDGSPSLRDLWVQYTDRPDVQSALADSPTSDKRLWDAYTLALNHNEEEMYDILCNVLDRVPRGNPLILEARLFMQARSRPILF
jgi:hypothetical protein